VKALFWTLLICVAAVVFYKFADGKMCEVERVRASCRNAPTARPQNDEGGRFVETSLPLAPAPFERSGEARQPVRMAVMEFLHKGKRHKEVRFISGEKSVLVGGFDKNVDINRRIGFGRVVVYVGEEHLATLFIQKGWNLDVGEDEEPEIDETRSTATWRKAWQDKNGVDRVCSYTVGGDGEGRVFVDYDFGVTETEARALGSVPFISSIGLPPNRCHDRVYGMGTTPHTAQDPSALASKGPPNYQNAVPVEEASDTFFYEPDNEARHFTLTLPEGLGQTAKWFEGLDGFGTENEVQKLHLRYFAFGDFSQVGALVRTKGRFIIDLCKSSAPLHKGEPAFNGVDFWAGDARHVPIPPTRNLLRNGSFEQNGKDWRWSYGGGKTDRVAPGEEHFAILEGGMGDGRALRIRQTQCGVLPLVSSSVPTVAGRKYTLSWYARSDNPNGNVVVMQCSAGRDGTGRGHYSHIRKPEPVKPGAEWKRYSTTFEGTAAGVFVQVNGYDAWVDRIMLEEGGAMTDYVEDPVQARLVTSNPDNDLKPGQPINARLELRGLKPISGTLRVSVKNFYWEEVFAETFDFALGSEPSTLQPFNLSTFQPASGAAEASSTLPLRLDAKRLGTGVFVVRMDFDADGKRWTDYCRFCIADPLDNTHPTAMFFCGGWGPWFGRIDRCVDVARKSKEWGFGSLTCQSLRNELYSKNEGTASLCRENNLKLVLHPVLYELPQMDMEKWKSLEPKDITDDLLRRLEDLAYKSAKECASDDTLWTFFNEEESMARRIGFENHFKLVMAAWRGCKRAFDERGLKLRFAPTHGVSHYFRGRNYDAIDGYLETAGNHGFRYDAVTIHSYQNIDGSILGPKDAEVETQHLIDRMKFYGYPDETPILLSECFNMLPWRVPEWGADGWSDGCWCGPPSEDFSLREFVHAGAMARLYLLALKFYPKVTQVNTWMGYKFAFVDHDLQPFAWMKMVNTLGHLLPDPRYYGGARPYPDVRGHVFIQGDKAILAVWTSNNDVERGTRKGPVLAMKLPADAKFVDLMGNERRGDGRAVPLTPAPLFVVSAKKNAAALVEAVKTAETDDQTQAIETEIRPMQDGAIEMEISNATSVPQKVKVGGGKTATLAGGVAKKGRIAPPKGIKPMEMYSFTTNYPFLSRPWKMSYFYVPKCGAKPDWANIPSLPIANEVRRSPAKPVTMKADYKMAWNEQRLFLRVEVEDDVPLRRAAFGRVERNHLYLIDECLEVYFDAFADGRRASIDGFDENDSHYDFADGSVWRMLAVNWQLAQGTTSATDDEVAEKLEQKWTPTEKGCIYEIAFAPRYLAPIELKPGTRASLGLFIYDRDTPADKGENGLSNATERGKVCNKLPRIWPEFILVP